MITGKTRVFFTIAAPVAQVRAPEVFNTVFGEQGIDAVMVPLHVSEENLEATIRALFKSPTTAGVALSIPHKLAAARIVDHRTEAASIANAVNAIRKNAKGELEGALFDGEGFLRSLDRHNMPYRARRILLIGAGGAASAIATALAATGPSHIAIFDPEKDQSTALSEGLTRYYGTVTSVHRDNDPWGFDLIINASPLGLRSDDPLPVPPERLSPNAQVCDILMKNQPTPLLKAAIARGNPVQPGFDMLLLQTPLYLDFFGFPDAAHVLRHDDSSIRQLLMPSEFRTAET